MYRRSPLPVRTHRRVRAALGREVGFHPHIGDQEAIPEGAAVSIEMHERAHRATRAVGDYYVTRTQRVRTVGRVDLQRNAFVGLRNTCDLVVPTGIEQGQLARPLSQISFD